MARDMNDIIGKEIGRLTPFAIDDDRKNGVYYFCRCNCENQTVVRKERRSLLKGQEKDLMCPKCKTKEVAKDIVGKEFANLKILKYDHVNKYGAIYYKCFCKLCNKTFDGERQAIRNGKTKQCPECTERLRREKFQKELQEPIGKTFGKLKVLSLNEEKCDGKHYWYTCQCDCENIVDVERLRLINGEATRCNECYWKERLQSQIDECINQKFGRLTVDSFAYLKDTNKEGEHLIMYNCSCDCKGAYKKIDITTGEEKNTGFKVVSKKDLKSGAVKSCGCLYDENLQQLWEDNTVHEMWQDSFYQCYYDILQRCYNPNNANYNRYGGRGITVCDEWRQPAPYGFLKFKEDMYESYKQYEAEHPDTKITINRINNDGNYSTDNCEWTDMYHQNNNTSRNKHYLYCGRWYTVSQLIANYAPYLQHSTLTERIERLGYQDGDEILDSTIFNPSGYDIGKEINCPIFFI